MKPKPFLLGIILAIFTLTDTTKPLNLHSLIMTAIITFIAIIFIGVIASLA